MEDLNAVQQEAVLHEKGPLLILAGAGSGKTRVITHRIAYLIHLREIAAYNISAVTFTNKATREMQERLLQLAGPVAAHLFVRTFHSLGLYVIRRHADLLGLKSGFSIVDQAGQISIIKAILKEKGLAAEEFPPQIIAQHINRARDCLLSPQEYQERLDESQALYDLLTPLYQEYILRLRKNNSVDFGDLLYETVQLLLLHKEIAARYRHLWRYFMIDEYQDTNHAQYVLGKCIAAEHRNIMAVGDDDQSIYSWRGADLGNILNFERDYPETKILKLEENYRSTAVILRAAAKVIAHNENRREKNIFTKRLTGDDIRLAVYGSGMEEAQGVVADIAELLEQNIDPAEIAIFYRTNAQSRIFEQILRQQGIPYLLVGDIRFYDRKEIKDILAYLNVIVNPSDSLSLERIINVPLRGLGASGLERLRSMAAMKNITLLEALPLSSELPGMRAHQKLKGLYKHFSHWQQAFSDGERPAKIAEDCLKGSGYLQALKEENSLEAATRIENLSEFINSLKEYERETLQNQGEPDLHDFLQQISLYSEERSDSEISFTPLCMMTLHNAKGLEFSHVFICGVEEGYLPHFLSMEGSQLEEERRLIYVGITRAKERLYLSRACFRQIYGRTKERFQSRFLEEMGNSLNRSFSANSLNGSFYSSQPEDLESYQAGEQIAHERYGRGEVLWTSETGLGQKVAIRFKEKNKERVFLTLYAPLQKI